MWTLKQRRIPTKTVRKLHTLSRTLLCSATQLGRKRGNAPPMLEIEPIISDSQSTAPSKRIAQASVRGPKVTYVQNNGSPHRGKQCPQRGGFPQTVDKTVEDVQSAQWHGCQPSHEEKNAKLVFSWGGGLSIA